MGFVQVVNAYNKLTWLEPAIALYQISSQLLKKLTSMSSKVEPSIWPRVTGHIGIHGRVDVRSHADQSQIFSHRWVPYFLTHGVPRAPSSPGAPL